MKRVFINDKTNISKEIDVNGNVNSHTYIMCNFKYFCKFQINFQDELQYVIVIT